VREKLARGDWSLEPAPNARSLRSYAEAWLTTMRAALKESTVAFYEANLSRHIT
jgi:hypothetical protein